jgi:phosphate acetyltransferase
MSELIERMRKVAAKRQPTILVCEGWDERCLRASARLLRDGICKIALLGEPQKIKSAAETYGVDISKARIVDHGDAALREELSHKLVEARKHKGMDLATAKKLLGDVNYFGCTYALAGHADGVAGSAICPTADLMRPALQILRRPEGIVSEVGVVFDPTRKKVFLVSDPSMNIDPTPEQLSQIAGNALGTAARFGIEPHVAFLSFSTKGSGGDNPSTQRVREAALLFSHAHQDIVADGEMQVDAAVSPQAAARKCPDSPLKGDANILIMPNLTAGNIFTHAMMQFSNLDFEFTIVEGMVKPVVILGRSVPLDVLENMIVSCAMQADDGS